jgi:flagellar biosynthesis/type III secretory pathway protein FliH
MPIIKRIQTSGAGKSPSQQGGHSKEQEFHPHNDTAPVHETTNEDTFAGLEWNGSTERRSPIASRRMEDYHNLSKFQNAEADYQKAMEAARTEGFHQGYESGYAEGFSKGLIKGQEAGYAEGMQEAQAASNAIWDIISQLDSAKNTVLSEAMEDLAPMAMAIAQRILKTEVACDRNLVISLALDVLEKVDRTQKEVVFKVHPSDVARLRHHIHENEEVWLGEVKRTLIVTGDDSVDVGSCMVETAGGQIDARFKTQLNVIRGLLGLVEEKEQVVSSESEFDHLLKTDEAV